MLTQLKNLRNALTVVFMRTLRLIMILKMKKGTTEIMKERRTMMMTKMRRSQSK